MSCMKQSITDEYSRPLYHINTKSFEFAVSDLCIRTAQLVLTFCTVSDFPLPKRGMKCSRLKSGS